MLIPEFLNGFDLEAAAYVRSKMLHTSSGFGYTNPTNFYQGSLIDGFLGGRAFFIFNTGFGERNFTARLGDTRSSVVFRCYMKATRVGLGTMPNVLFLRFQLGTGHQISLQWNADHTVRVVRSGSGTNENTGGTVITTLPGIFDWDQWADMEIRIDFASGRLRIWRDSVSIFDNSGLSLGSGCDRITLRWQALGTVGMAWDHVAMGYDTTISDERFGACRVIPVALAGDYSVSGGWAPNAGTAHFSRLTESATVSPFAAPDEDVSYLVGNQDSGVELFAVAEPLCVGYNFGVAVNISTKWVGGNPAIRHLSRTPDGALVDLTASPFTSVLNEDDIYLNKQAMINTNPDTDEVFSDRQIQESAWGFAPATISGEQRVTMLYLEKLTSIAGVLPFDCGGGSYIL